MQVSVTSIKGKREQNEDMHNIVMNGGGKNKNIKNINFFALYDGHGGKYVSKMLSDVLPVYFLDKRVEYPLDKRYVKSVFNQVQSMIAKSENSNHCGSTALTMSHYKNKNSKYLDIANLGDCKAVLCKGTQAIPLTRDHRPMWPDEKKRIEQLGGKVVFDGEDWRVKDYSVSRSFGDLNAKPFMSHVPDLYKYKLDANDKFVVLGCDGLWDYVSEQDVVNFVLGHVYKNGRKVTENTKNISNKLANVALKKGSTDNVSVITVFL